MVTLALFGLLAVLVAGVLFLAAAYLLPAGEQIAPSIRDEPLWELPGGRSLRTEDIAAVRLPVALRGYRFAETDLLLDRLGDELRARDEEIARLKGDVPASGAEAEPAPEADEQLWQRGSGHGLGDEKPASEADAAVEGEAERPANERPADERPADERPADEQPERRAGSDVSAD